MLNVDVENGIAQLGAVWSDLDARRQRVMARLGDANIEAVHESGGDVGNK